MEWSLLAGLEPTEREAVLACGRRRHYRRHEIVWHEGDPGDTLHLVRSGRLAVRVTTPGGDRATLAVVGPGDAVGELALLNRPHRRTATLEALEAVETLALGQHDFNDLRARHPAVDDVLLDLLAGRVERLGQQLLDSRYASANRRVARALADLARVYGAGGAAVIPLTQDEIADLAGTTRPTLNQALQSLAAAGLVALSRGRIEVRDVAALRRRAGA